MRCPLGVRRLVSGRSDSALQVQDKRTADKAMRVLWLLLTASHARLLAPARRRTCVRQRSIEEDLMEELDATAEAAEEDVEEEARYRADLEERTNKAKAATCWEGLPDRPQ